MPNEIETTDVVRAPRPTFTVGELALMPQLVRDRMFQHEHWTWLSVMGGNEMQAYAIPETDFFDITIHRDVLGVSLKILLRVGLGKNETCWTVVHEETTPLNADQMLFISDLETKGQLLRNWKEGE